MNSPDGSEYKVLPCVYLTNLHQDRFFKCIFIKNIFPKF